MAVRLLISIIIWLYAIGGWMLWQTRGIDPKIFNQSNKKITKLIFWSSWPFIATFVFIEAITRKK